jgi:ribosomal protein S7
MIFSRRVGNNYSPWFHTLLLSDHIGTLNSFRTILKTDLSQIASISSFTPKNCRSFVSSPYPLAKTLPMHQNSISSSVNLNEDNILLKNFKIEPEIQDQVNLLQKCTKLLTKKGKQSKAQKIVANTLERLQEQASALDTENSQKNQSRDISISKKRVSKDKNISQQGWHQLKKSPSEKYSAFDIFEQAIYNIKPLFELRKIRLSGTPQQFPAVLSRQRQEKIAIRWLVQAAQTKKKKSRSSHGIDYFLALEILDAFKKQGELRQKRDEIHRTAERNRSLAHRRWWP